MNEIDFMSSLHKSTKRDYLARVNDSEYPKEKAAQLAKKFESTRLINVDNVTLKNLERVGCMRDLLLFEDL